MIGLVYIGREMEEEIEEELSWNTMTMHHHLYLKKLMNE